MKSLVFKCRDNDHKNDNMKINRGMKGKKNGLPEGSRNKVRVVLCRMRRKHMWQRCVGMIRRFSVASGIGCRMRRKRLIRPTG
ncbi:hypothetical protein EC881467_3166 [Escherichia coli 88.1467]|nr:hypothetical protein BFL18_15315 [Escherichia coli]EKV79218.1 hypothetical protein EC881467_3166 [Escherichia coli 88.1467]